MEKQFQQECNFYLAWSEEVFYQPPNMPRSKTTRFLPDKPCDLLWWPVMVSPHPRRVGVALELKQSSTPASWPTSQFRRSQIEFMDPFDAPGTGGIGWVVVNWRSNREDLKPAHWKAWVPLLEPELDPRRIFEPEELHPGCWGWAPEVFNVTFAMRAHRLLQVMRGKNLRSVEPKHLTRLGARRVPAFLVDKQPTWDLAVLL